MEPSAYWDARIYPAVGVTSARAWFRRNIPAGSSIFFNRTFSRNVISPPADIRRQNRKNTAACPPWFFANRGYLLYLAFRKPRSLSHYYFMADFSHLLWIFFGMGMFLLFSPDRGIAALYEAAPYLIIFLTAGVFLLQALRHKKGGAGKCALPITSPPRPFYAAVPAKRTHRQSGK